MKKKKQRLNNKGFSLVELIIVIAIVAVVGGMIASFVITSQNNYNQGIAETDLQYEAQLLGNQLQELLIDAKKGVAYKYVSAPAEGAEVETFLFDDAEIDEADAVTAKELYIYTTDTYCLVKWDGVDKKVYYTEYSTAEGNPVIAGPELLAEFVSDFSVDISDVASNGTVRYQLGFTKEVSGREYTTSHKIKMRNSVVANVGYEQMYGTAPEAPAPAGP